MKNTSLRIVGITGKTAAGKTTLTKALALEFQATSLFWDDFESISIFPDNYVDWFQRGQDYTEWDCEKLTNILCTLKQGKAIMHPILDTLLNPTLFIFFDAPLGRLHHQTGKYIDTCIHVETPLDVLLARRIIRDYRNQKSNNDIVEELQFYLSHSRALFFDEALKASADYIVDGLLSTQEQVKIIKNYLNF